MQRSLNCWRGEKRGGVAERKDTNGGKRWEELRGQFYYKTDDEVRVCVPLPQHEQKSKVYKSSCTVPYTHMGCWPDTHSQTHTHSTDANLLNRACTVPDEDLIKSKRTWTFADCTRWLFAKFSSHYLCRTLCLSHVFSEIAFFSYKCDSKRKPDTRLSRSIPRNLFNYATWKLLYNWLIFKL